MANVLKKITAEAKRIYARGGTWRGAIKSAGVKYRAGKLGRVGSSVGKKRKLPKRIKPRKYSRVRIIGSQAAVVTGGGGTLAGHISEAKKILATRIANAERSKFLATKRSVKKQYAKQIAALKFQYRKLS